MEIEIGKLIERLQLVQHRPAMFIGLLHERSSWTMQCYLFGFRAGISAAGLQDVSGWTDNATRLRGWKISGEGPIPQMREKGMSELEIVIELVEIEVEALRELQQSAHENLAPDCGQNGRLVWCACQNGDRQDNHIKAPAGEGFEERGKSHRVVRDVVAPSYHRRDMLRAARCQQIHVVVPERLRQIVRAGVFCNRVALRPKRTGQPVPRITGGVHPRWNLFRNPWNHNNLR